MSDYTLRFIAVMLMTAVTDVLFGLYIRRAAQGKAFEAAIYGSLIFGAGAFITLSYVVDPTYAIAAIIGGFTGTYCIVRYDSRKKS